MTAPYDAMVAGGEPAAGFRERITRLLRKAPTDCFKAYGFAQCTPATWIFAGVDIRAGDRATALAARPTDAGHHFSPPPRLSMRVGPRGSIIQGARNTHSIVASGNGPLEVSVDVPARRQVPKAGPGNGGPPPAPTAIVAIVWRESALRGLRALANYGDVDGLVRDEINRLCNPAEARAPGLPPDCRRP